MKQFYFDTDGHNRAAPDGHFQDGGVQVILRRSSSRWPFFYNISNGNQCLKLILFNMLNPLIAVVVYVVPPWTGLSYEKEGIFDVRDGD